MLDIQPGDRVTVTDTENSKTLLVAALTFEEHRGLRHGIGVLRGHDLPKQT